MSTERIELTLLSAIVKWGKRELRNEVAELTENDFSTESLRSFFVKMRNVGFDTAVLISQLTAGDIALFERITNEPSFISEFAPYVVKLKELAASRRLKAELTAIALTGDDVIVTPDDILRLAEKEMKNLSGILSTEYLDGYLKSLTEPRHCVNLGFELFDKHIGGLEIPSVCIIGARPSTGKTSFALNVALAATKKQNKTLIFSLEMTAEAITDRLISIAMSVDYGRLTARTLSSKEIDKCKVFVEWLKSGDIIIFDKTYNIEGIAAAVRRIKPQIVIIDYIQIVTSLRRFGSIREHINHVSAEIKRIAKDNNCCMVVLSQLKRDGKSAPTMADLKESGSLEADGDYILLMHRPYVLDKRQFDDSGNPNPKPGETQIIIDKNKYGNCGIFAFEFKGETQKFYEVDKKREQT